mmetsp:Transcript_7307/g.9258  ORF Transcript_7307/g.9258 Transcript_7307/m.9258 type:complete len:214 (-) Transcript_7307:137-778(-)|eukprot:CAMPEP_0204850076 /NCGR_PEP_ID=MMETSP1347-20130617/7416_1 /ASSEMBLY_ACC=CAM_ASM_000690 /TAXON_ID=215587 /ORGANISM="Aplanochytrium stocchinoi, Strain GSBS06" /LENGTH=213 /DNA_ID=CAMNT_0051992795 /DNA_START=114 /DNA_END=755 /DNA_ORIENTATION=+
MAEAEKDVLTDLENGGEDLEKAANEAWKEIIEIGGETIYVFLQRKKIYPFGMLLGIVTTAFQLFTFFIFFNEAVKCGVRDDADCSLSGGGFLITNNNSTGETKIDINGTGSVTALGISLGIIITLNFLVPDFIRGAAFLREGYPVIALVHFSISLAAIGCTLMYTVTTAASDVEILTSVVVLLFITDLDEKMFTIHKAGTAFIYGEVKSLRVE